MNLVGAPEPIAVLSLIRNILCSIKLLRNLLANRTMICIETHGVLPPPPQSYKDPLHQSSFLILT